VLKVLQLIPTLDRSGAEKQMALLARDLPRDRYHVEVAALTRLGPIQADLEAFGVPVTLIGKRHKLDPLALSRLTQLLKKNYFHILHTWLFAAHVYGRVAARRVGVPVVVASEMAVDLWKGKAERTVDRLLAPWVDRVVGNSQAVVDFYRGLGIPDDKLIRIYSGIDDEPVPAILRENVLAEFGWPADASLIVYAGRLAPQKGVEDLLHALDILQHVRPRMRALIVGEGPSRSRLEARARGFALLDRVRFTGHRDDVPRLLTAADLLVLPSLYEGLPNVVLEAMQVRKPVVATAAPGTTELVIDGQTGLLVPMRQPVPLAEAMRRLLDDPDLARRLGEAGHARVAAEFRTATMVERFAALYDDLARAKGLS
jgi:glycosyltransferase involved in cell wall biosynthesis